MYKIMSANVLGKYPKHESENEITEARMKAIAECVAHYAPDSVGVQEYGTQNQLFLSKYLPSKYVFTDEKPGWIATFYDAEKYTLRYNGFIRLTTSSNQGYRFTVAVFADRQSGDLAYIHGNLHLEYKDSETRLIDAEEINRELVRFFAENEQYLKLPLVITGDYNARPDTEPAVFSAIAGDFNIKNATDVALQAECTQDTFHAVGVPVGAGMPCDHVLVNCDSTQVHRHDIITENDYAGILTASDHYPVLAEFSAI